MSKPMIYRCDPRVKKPKNPYGKPRVRNLSKERVYELTKGVILAQKERALKGVIPQHLMVTAEELAAELNVDPSKVVWSLAQLNLQGLVTQKWRAYTRDFQARRSFYPDEVGGWSAKHYHIVLPEPKLGPPIPPKPEKWPEGTIPVWDEKDASKQGRYSKRLGYRLRLHEG